MYVCMYVCAWTDIGCYVEVPPSYLRRPLLLRYRILSGTCTNSWCYVTWPSIVHTADSWCNVIRNYKISSPTSVDAWCYVTRSSLALAQTLGAILIDLLLFFHTLEVIRSSRVLAQTLGLGATFPRTFDAALQGAGLPGRRPGPYIYICI